MADPYRDRRAPAPHRGEAGIVDDMIRQFTDPYTFLRELVQNAIDAGTSAVQIEIERGDRGLVHTTIWDDGSGMTRHVIETCLLRSFASSKEDVPGKIGKYGIGFLSVLAVDPAEVVVDTWSPEGAYTVRVFPDQTYRLESGTARRGTSGTAVTVVQLMSAADGVSHGQRVRTTLRHWCRHVSVPLTLLDTYGGRTPERLDEPMTLVAPVAVRVERASASIVIGHVAGCSQLRGAANHPEGVGAFAGFYNGGLTLYETTQESFEGLDGLRFKILSPHLSHTLSRDNVRRDDNLRDLLQQVREAAKGALASALGKRVTQVVASIFERGWGDEDRAVYVAAASHLPVGRIPLPLTDPIGDRLWMDRDMIRSDTPTGSPVLFAPVSSPLTRLLAARGQPVVRADASPDAQAFNAILLRIVYPSRAAEARALMFAAEVIELGEGLRLQQQVLECLRAVRIAARGIGFFRPVGEQVDRTVIAREPSGAKEIVVLREDLAARVTKLESSQLLLNVDDELVRRAIAAAPGESLRAAVRLTRVALLELGGALSPEANEALLERAVS